MREVQSCSAIHAVQPRRARLSPGAGPPDAARSDPYACRALLGRSPGCPAVQEVAVSDRHFLSRSREPDPHDRDGGRRRVPSSLFEAYSHRLTTSRQVRHNIISLVGLDGAPVLNQSGDEVGHLVDIVARVGGGDDYPAVTGIVVRVGRRHAYLDASVTLKTARMDLREFQRREGEVLLARDILDHQLVDTDEVQVIRAADLYRAQVGDQ